MIFNDRKSRLHPNPPQALLDAASKWQEIAETADKMLIKDSVYKGTETKKGIKRHTVREILCEIYHNKCAYCENKEYKPDVEHYRPKKEVIEDKKHPGYYWLCYEWSNLLPSCADCNRPPSKGKKFPVIGAYETKPSFLPSGALDKEKCKAALSPLIEEKPYLLHPEIDDCKQFFKFYINGKIEGTDSNKRGEKTIEICDLNRANLRYRRQKILDDFVESIEQLLKLFLGEDLDEKGLKNGLKTCFEKLDNLCQPHQEFSLTATYARAHFDQMIVPLIQQFYQTIISQAHKKYLNGSL